MHFRSFSRKRTRNTLVTVTVTVVTVNPQERRLADGFDGDHARSDERDPEVDLATSLLLRVLAADDHHVDGVRVAEEAVVGHVVRLDAREVPDTHVASN